MANLIKISGEEITVTPANNVSFTVEEVQGYVQGFFETYRLGKNKWLVCNEDGKQLGLKPNRKATILFNRLHLNSDTILDVVVGNVLIVSTDEMTPNTEE